MLIILNLTNRPLTHQQIEAARTTTLEQVDPLFRRDVERGLRVREIRRMADVTADEWMVAVILPWLDMRQREARGLLDAANAARGYNWPVGVTLDASWWVIWGWDDLDGVVGRGGA